MDGKQMREKKKKKLLSDINSSARKDLAFFNQAFQFYYSEQIWMGNTIRTIYTTSPRKVTISKHISVLPTNTQAGANYAWKFPIHKPKRNQLKWKEFNWIELKGLASVVWMQ